jgi:hypothetical protein
VGIFATWNPSICCGPNLEIQWNLKEIRSCPKKTSTGLEQQIQNFVHIEKISLHFMYQHVAILETKVIFIFKVLFMYVFICI